MPSENDVLYFIAVSRLVLEAYKIKEFALIHPWLNSGLFLCPLRQHLLATTCPEIREGGTPARYRKLTRIKQVIDLFVYHRRLQIGGLHHRIRQAVGIAFVGVVILNKIAVGMGPFVDYVVPTDSPVSRSSRSSARW